MSDSEGPRIESLLAEAAAIARPAPVKCTPSERDQSMIRARERFASLVQLSGRRGREFAEDLLGCDESAVRRALSKGLGLPIPWWLERLIHRDPELVARWVAGILRDCRLSIAARGDGTDG